MEKTCDIGLHPQKVGSESDLVILENLGYIQRLQRKDWNAVIVPCNRQDKVFKDVEGFSTFLKEQEIVPIEETPLADSPTSTIDIIK